MVLFFLIPQICQTGAPIVCLVLQPTPTEEHFAMNIRKRRSFGELRGLSVLCNLSINQLKRLLGATDAELASWAAGESMVPRHILRTSILYAVACTENLMAVDEVHRAVIDNPTRPHLSGADGSLAELLVEAGFDVTRESAGSFANVLGVPARMVRAWLRGDLEPPQFLYPFLTLLCHFDVSRRCDLIYAMSLVSCGSIRNPANRDTELRLGIAACNLTIYGLAKILDVPESIILEWANGERQIPRDVWKILELYLMAPPFALDHLEKQVFHSPRRLSGPDGSLLRAFEIAGFATRNERRPDVDGLAVFLDCQPSTIDHWLGGIEQPPSHLWTLFMLLANVEPQQRAAYVAAFVDRAPPAGRAAGSEILIHEFSSLETVRRSGNEMLH